LGVQGSSYCVNNNLVSVFVLLQLVEQLYASLFTLY